MSGLPSIECGTRSCTRPTNWANLHCFAHRPVNRECFHSKTIIQMIIATNSVQSKFNGAIKPFEMRSLVLSLFVHPCRDDAFSCLVVPFQMERPIAQCSTQTTRALGNAFTDLELSMSIRTLCGTIETISIPEHKMFPMNYYFVFVSIWPTTVLWKVFHGQSTNQRAVKLYKLLSLFVRVRLPVPTGTTNNRMAFHCFLLLKGCNPCLVFHDSGQASRCCLLAFLVGWL